MYTLFIDTHSEVITIGLCDGNNVIEKTKTSVESHSVYLVPMLKELLEESKVSFSDIKNIVAVNGPGSFTGIRIGLSVAKAISYSLNKPIFLVSSLTAMLVSNTDNEDKLAVIPDNKGYYVSVFDKDNNVIIEEHYRDNIDNLMKKYKSVDTPLNIKAVIDYVLKGESVSVFSVKANYVKSIEVMNDRK